MFEIIEKTIGDYLKDIVIKYPNNEAVVYPFRGIRLSYKELDLLTDKLAKGLLASGLKKGDHVAIWAHNVPEWIYLLFATAKVGVVTVTVNTLYRAHELKYLLHQSDSKALFMVKGFKTDYVETIHEILPGLKNSKSTLIKNDSLPLLEKIYFIGENTPNGMENFEVLFKLADQVSDEELEKVKRSLDKNDIINMQYTSGTTGFPKGVMLSHFNVLNNAFAIAKGMNFTEKDRLCIPVPFFHCFGLVLSILVCLTSGATMVPVEKFTPVDVLKTVEMEKCTALHGVPTMFLSELNLLEKEHYDTSSLRTGIMAGAPCPVEVMKAVMTKMNMREITIVYGLTEASPGLTMTKIDDPVEKRVETVGKELPGAEIKIVNPETEEECPPNIPGELWARGYNIMCGYYKMEEATKHAFSKDGWLRTGDLALKTDDRYYKITGRIKDMIIRGGENIYPKEIEDFFYTHPKILDIQVVGVADEKYGEEAMAFVIPKEGEILTEEELRNYAKGKIADFKIPKYFAFIREYPMTASGKIQKYKLSELGNKIIKERQLQSKILGDIKKDEFEIILPEYFNFGFDVIDKWAEIDDKVALLWIDTDGKTYKTFRFSDLKRISDKFANILIERGYKKGDMLFVMVPRVPEWYAVMLGCFKVGVVPMPAPKILRPKDINYRLEKSEAKGAVVYYNVLDKMMEVDTSKLSHKMVIGAEAPGWENFEKAMEKASEKLIMEKIEKTRIDDPLIIYFTSGTTDFPKMVLHDNSYAIGHQITARFWQDLRKNDIHWTLSDTGWGKAVWGKMFGQWFIGTTVLMYNSADSFDPKIHLKIMEHFKVTTFCAPPTAYRMLILEDLSKYNFNSLRHSVSAGEPLNPAVFERWLEYTGNKIYDGYGQTETINIIATVPGMEVKPGSMGKPTFGFEVDILDDEGNPVENGDVGHIALKIKPNRPVGFFKGYYKDEEATKNAIHGDWYFTGDKAHKDKDGYFWFVGRADDVIKTSGYRVGPFEVESALQSHPAVAENAVIGVPDELRGMIIKAFVVLKTGYEPSETLVHELQEHVKRETAPYKYPRKIEFVSALPKTVSGKIRRTELREMEERKMREKKDEFFTP